MNKNSDFVQYVLGLLDCEAIDVHVCYHGADTADIDGAKFEF